MHETPLLGNAYSNLLLLSTQHCFQPFIKRQNFIKLFFIFKTKTIAAFYYNFQKYGILNEAASEKRTNGEYFVKTWMQEENPEIVKLALGFSTVQAFF